MTGAFALQLQNCKKYSLLDTNVDIKGVAFETFVGANLRGEHGEFFTPREIVFMATEAIMPKIDETVCDPACGSGGFLVMALKISANNMRICIKNVQH